LIHFYKRRKELKADRIEVDQDGSGERSLDDSCQPGVDVDGVRTMFSVPLWSQHQL